MMHDVYDEQPDDPHAECTQEITRLQAELKTRTAERDRYKLAFKEMKELAEMVLYKTTSTGGRWLSNSWYQGPKVNFDIAARYKKTSVVGDVLDDIARRAFKGEKGKQ